MKKIIQSFNAKKYFAENKLDKLKLSNAKKEIHLNKGDLALLHYLICKIMPKNVLEFGSGYSTVVIAAALKENFLKQNIQLSNSKKDFKPQKPKCFSIETSKKWLKNTNDKLQENNLRDFVKISLSKCIISEIQGQVCHFYKSLPNIVPDFVYLDGPDPNDVSGSINGISMQNCKRTVMAADMLKYESTHLPGFTMLVDGRTNNARFLARLFTRRFSSFYCKKKDISFFQLNERPLR